MKLRNFYVLIFIIALFVSGAFAQKSGLPRLKKGESYATVREKMLKAGWKPYTAPDADQCSEGDKRCENRPEMQNCAGTGLAPCRFLWKRNDKTVVIFTIGEEAGFNGYEFIK